VLEKPEFHARALGIFENLMDDFANASFAPDLIEVMRNALEGATLPRPVSSSHIKSIAELRSASEGERDPNTLQTMALLELHLSQCYLFTFPLALKPADGFNHQPL
jgi:hypothetical protein